MTKGDIAPNNVPFLMGKDEDKPGGLQCKRETFAGTGERNRKAYHDENR